MTAVSELAEEIPADSDVCVALWLVGQDLHYSWFGLDADELIDILERMTQHLKKSGPSPTRH